MGLPLDSIHECFALNFPDCMGKITKCPNLMDCHNEYSGTATRKGRETLLRMIDDDIRFWQRALIVFIFLPPIILLILLVIT